MGVWIKEDRNEHTITNTFKYSTSSIYSKAVSAANNRAC